MSESILDATDRRILDALQRDASLPRKRLAELCHVSEATCSRRIARLTRHGYILRHMAVLDRARLGLGLTVFVLVALEKEHPPEMRRFTEALGRHPNVLAVSFISGEYDYLLQVAVPDMARYHDFCEQFMVPDYFVKRFVSLFEMKSLKSHAPLPILEGG